MKKSTFAAMILGTIGGLLFALGMCMALIPEWNAFGPGVILGVIGAAVLLVMVLVWRRMEKQRTDQTVRKNDRRSIARDRRSPAVRRRYVPHNGMEPYGSRNCSRDRRYRRSSLPDPLYQGIQVKQEDFIYEKSKRNKGEKI